MGNIAIKVNNLGKRYRIGMEEQRHESLAEMVTSWVKTPLQNFRDLRRLSRFEEDEGEDIIWAVRDISFEVKHGEVLGLIGHNGAGKSTLLKLLSRITEPTTGYAQLNGRVSSLLEVGTGFHPELTGRENVYLNGTILGMRKAEIERKFDEIVDFSGVEKFIDTPVKRYSSGMRVRLGFAVAAHLEPEILMIDEVLSVGDAAFQKKCLEKMDSIAGEGRTVLFVSHNMLAVQTLCPRVILLKGGTVVKDGPSDEIITEYMSQVGERSTLRVWDDFDSAPGDETARLHRVEVKSAQEFIDMETEIQVNIEYWNKQPDAYLHVTMHLLNDRGIIAFTSGSLLDERWNSKSYGTGLFRSSGVIPANLLNSGVYYINILIVKEGNRVVHKEEHAVAFEVIENRSRKGAWYGKNPGVVRPSLHWSTEEVEPDAADSVQVFRGFH